MGTHQDANLIMRLHQLVILVLILFSLFVKPEVKMFFWLVIAGAGISLLIRTALAEGEQDPFSDPSTEGWSVKAGKRKQNG